MPRIIIALILGAVASSMSFVVAAEGAQLKGDALATAVTGKRFTGATSNGGTWEVTYSKDGKMDVVVLNSSWSDTGTWAIKGDRLCSERTKRSYMCYELMRVSDDEYHWVDERGQTDKSSGPK